LKVKADALLELAVAVLASLLASRPDAAAGPPLPLDNHFAFDDGQSCTKEAEKSAGK
jgi:hypothetical protein